MFLIIRIILLIKILVFVCFIIIYASLLLLLQILETLELDLIIVVRKKIKERLLQSKRVCCEI